MEGVLTEPEKSAWSDDELTALKRHLRAGLTASQISARMGRTRNAVTGMTKRLRNSGDVVITKMVTLANANSQVGAPQQIFGEDEGLELTDLTARQCRFSVGAREDGVWVFCGAETPQAGASFCKAHHRLAYVPIQRRR